jgi:glucosamine-6-phosphate deaminase
MNSPKTNQGASFVVDQLNVEIHANRQALGRAAGAAAADQLRSVLARQDGARVIFACAPSQDETLEELMSQPGISWDRVTAFHMDEYVGLSAGHPASFRRYLREHVTSRTRFRAVNELGGDARDPGAECARYAALLAAAPIDLVCLGIGENGHLAFNDPPVADFDDPLRVKRVMLDEACRAQQVNDGCFMSLGDVPREALSLTIPALLSGAHLVCSVPGPRKASAVRATLRGPVVTACPASVLRRHAGATLYLDRDSASHLGDVAVSHA